MFSWSYSWFRLLCLLTLTSSMLVGCRAESVPASPKPTPPRFLTPTTVLPTVAPPADWLILERYQFPDRVPLRIRDGAVSWIVDVHGQRYDLPTRLTQATLRQTCALRPDQLMALCRATRNAADNESFLAALPDDHRAAAAAAIFDVFASHNPYFLLARDSSDILILNHDMDPRTQCRWYTAIQIACLTSHGTGVWTVALFDTQNRRYVALPVDANIEWSYAFRQGYIHVVDAPPRMQTFTIYSFTHVVLTHFQTESLATTTDTLLFLTPCHQSQVCVQAIRIGSNGVEQTSQWDLGVSHATMQRCQGALAVRDTMAIVTWCDQEVSRSLAEIFNS
jgi:hypothetical protein